MDIPALGACLLESNDPPGSRPCGASKPPTSPGPRTPGPTPTTRRTPATLPPPVPTFRSPGRADRTLTARARWGRTYLDSSSGSLRVPPVRRVLRVASLFVPRSSGLRSFFSKSSLFFFLFPPILRFVRQAAVLPGEARGRRGRSDREGEDRGATNGANLCFGQKRTVENTATPQRTRFDAAKDFFGLRVNGFARRKLMIDQLFSNQTILLSRVEW